MKKRKAYAITFCLQLNSDIIEETVHLSNRAYNNLPLTSDLRYPNTETIIPDYFTKEKIDEFKKKICEQIMNDNNSFDIYEIDADYYPVEKDKIWK